MEPMSRSERDKREKDIQYLEEVSLNAWPSYMIELYDGWLIRFPSPSRRRSPTVRLSMTTSAVPAPSRSSLSWIPRLIIVSPSAAMMSGTLRR